ncbi:MAG: mechanosensitive ion channel [Dehalococcoidia bacterium]|nr:mechanosensitive ion channel [Dehalococcoidia bacterium]
MSEQFIASGGWILIAVAVGFVLFYLLKHWTPRVIEKLVPEQWREQLKGVQKVVSWVVTVVGGLLLALAVVGVAVSFYGVDFTPALQAVSSWLLGHGVRILAIILLSYLTYIIIRAVMPTIVERYVIAKGKRRRSKTYLAKRSQTLGSVLTNAIGGFILIIAIFMILSEAGLDITPLLAGAGVAGIAIGFAAQNSIRDLIAGFVIMLEDQYNVGDVVKVADIAGLVEGLNLRRTVLRDLDGILHVVPNGEIRVASNYTRSWSRAHLNISVAYKEDLDRVMSVIRKAWEKMAKNPKWEPQLISKTPEILRVNEFGDSGIIIKVVGETKAMAQWDVMGELRRRIKSVFDKEGIEIPWPHVKLYMGESPSDKGLACRTCSGVNLPGSKFCSHCGAKLSG